MKSDPRADLYRTPDRSLVDSPKGRQFLQLLSSDRRKEPSFTSERTVNFYFRSRPSQLGVPWGRDRLVPTFLATLAIRQQKPRITFRSAAEMLEVFGLQQGGTRYRRLITSLQRVFGATIFFGTDTPVAFQLHAGGADLVLA